MKSKVLSKCITDFLEYCEIERGRSPRTVSNYAFYLGRFVEFAGDIAPAREDRGSRGEAAGQRRAGAGDGR